MANKNIKKALIITSVFGAFLTALYLNYSHTPKHSHTENQNADYYFLELESRTLNPFRERSLILSYNFHQRKIVIEENLWERGYLNKLKKIYPFSFAIKKDYVDGGGRYGSADGKIDYVQIWRNTGTNIIIEKKVIPPFTKEFDRANRQMKKLLEEISLQAEHLPSDIQKLLTPHRISHISPLRSSKE